MRSGRLRHRLQLQQPSRTRDALGGSIAGWSTVATVWGGVEALSATEQFSVGQENYSLQVRIVIRYGSEWSSLNSTWRVKDANTGRKYAIVSVIQPEHRSRPNTVIEMIAFEDERDDD